jgi:hypothetical protein
MINLQRNSNSLDRTARLIIGIASIAVAFPGVPLLDGLFFRYVILAFGVANLLTTLTGWCPIYALVGIGSLKKPSTDK